MTFIPRNTHIHCDCLQPGCPYCDRDGSRKRQHDKMMQDIVEKYTHKKRKQKLERILKNNQ